MTYARKEYDMAQENFDMIIKNVNMLLEKKNWKPANLIELTGIPQSQMSKVLNGKARFTLEQIIAVADAFNVSIDFLIGREQKYTQTTLPTNKEIYEFFAPLLETTTLRSIYVNVEEDAYELIDEPFTYPYGFTKKTSSYKAFYFSNYTQLPNASDLSADECNTLDMELGINGNGFERNKELNEFLTYYYKLYDLKKNSGMDEDIYETAINDRLDKLKY